jgi:hypothetical protein
MNFCTTGLTDMCRSRSNFTFVPCFLWLLSGIADTVKELGFALEQLGGQPSCKPRWRVAGPHTHCGTTTHTTGSQESATVVCVLCSMCMRAYARNNNYIFAEHLTVSGSVFIKHRTKLVGPIVIDCNIWKPTGYYIYHLL